MDRKYQTRRAVELQTGDRFVSHKTEVSYTGKAEVDTDLFGRAVNKLWCIRHDTGASGWMVFGPEGVVLAIEPE